MMDCAVKRLDEDATNNRTQRSPQSSSFEINAYRADADVVAIGFSRKLFQQPRIDLGEGFAAPGSARAY